jgi:hypothetical protein
MPLSRQCQTVLDHLRRVGSITPVEAQVVHRIRSLPRRILDLKDAGYDIKSVRAQDITGQRYVRYVLNEKEAA